MSKKEIRNESEELAKRFKNLLVMLAHKKMGEMPDYGSEKTAYDYFGDYVWFKGARQASNILANLDSMKFFFIRKAYTHFKDERIIQMVNELMRYQSQPEQLSLLKKN